MSNSYSVLENARKSYNEFAEAVLPEDVRACEDLSFSDLAKYIDDRGVRDEFCRRAITMLDANISHYRGDATLIHAKGRNQPFIVASTLIVAGVVHYFFGLAAALIGAGFWYWLAAESAGKRAEADAAAASSHNAEVENWRETIRGWEAEREDLRQVKDSVGA